MVIFLLILTIILGTIVFIALGAIIEGWVLTILWGWFMVPLFHLPELSLLFGIGLALIVSFIAKQPQILSKAVAEEQRIHILISSIIRPFVFLFW